MNVALSVIYALSVAAFFESGGCDRVCGLQNLNYVPSGPLQSFSTLISHKLFECLGICAGENLFIFVLGYDPTITHINAKYALHMFI